MRTLVIDETLCSKCASYVHKFLDLDQTVPISNEDEKSSTLPILIGSDSIADFSTSGLCNVVRQLFKMAIGVETCEKKKRKLTAMLVSPWTSYCELDLPTTINKLSQNLSNKLHDQTLIIPDEILSFERELSEPKRHCNPVKYLKSRKRKDLCERDGVEVLQNIDLSIARKFFEKLGFTETKKLPKINNEKINLLVGEFACGPYFLIVDLIVLFMLLSYLSKMPCTCHLKVFFNNVPNIYRWLTLCLNKQAIYVTCLDAFANTESIFACTEMCEDISCSFVTCPNDVSGILPREKRSNHKQVHTQISNALPEIYEKLDSDGLLKYHDDNVDVVDIEWGKIPEELNPSVGGINEQRSIRKRQQLSNMLTHVTQISRAGDIIVDFCSGGGHLGIVVAYSLPHCQIILVENKEESIDRALDRIKELNLRNIRVYLSNLNYFTGPFDVGISLHACGSATDLVLAKCLEKNASFIISPCCYGGIQIAHDLFTYPKSKHFRSRISEEKYYLLTRSADRNCADKDSDYIKEGKLGMILTDADRILHTIENGYSSYIFSMKPLTCSPKNNIIVGTINR